jgi:regulatory factor X
MKQFSYYLSLTMPFSFSDWIAVNVLRNVALSTNSVAASVEPVMQQNFFSLGADEGFGSMDVRPQNMMAHTPTTSSMLAALQQDTFGPSLDTSASAYNPDGYGPMAYMDTSNNHDDLGSSHQPGLSFSDFTPSGGAFDVPSFASQDLGLSNAGTPASEPERTKQEEIAKDDLPATS